MHKYFKARHPGRDSRDPDYMDVNSPPSTVLVPTRCARRYTHLDVGRNKPARRLQGWAFPASLEEMSGQTAQLHELMALFTVTNSVGAVLSANKVTPFKAVAKKTPVIKRANHEAEFVKF
jgi:hypothetical protein